MGVNRDTYEGRSYYYCQCLNCSEKMEIPKCNMEAARIIDARKHVRVSNIMVLDIVDQAKERYHLLRDCYYKYPEILKKPGRSDTVTYKVMRKRYETE